MQSSQVSKYENTHVIMWQKGNHLPLITPHPHFLRVSLFSFPSNKELILFVVFWFVGVEYCQKCVFLEDFEVHPPLLNSFFRKCVTGFWGSKCESFRYKCLFDLNYYYYLKCAKNAKQNLMSRFKISTDRWLKLHYGSHKPLQHTRKSFSFFPPFEESLLDLHRRVSLLNRC